MLYLELCQTVRVKKVLITYIDKGQHQLTHVKDDQDLYLSFTALLDTIAPDKSTEFFLFLHKKHTLRVLIRCALLRHF